ncbi:hypothetical protein EBBID32_44330 [Sphingobium indicum BiD32]|uniref:Uncharacterized protein n=1 Tax=Sphingobium indicum BiD32 TaxID=1301087 RepID=N1MWY1_9SPHN|nr:hypothetical protein EBBID32_44330 [Sphingobium indicum BiD32]
MFEQPDHGRTIGPGGVGPGLTMAVRKSDRDIPCPKMAKKS